MPESTNETPAKAHTSLYYCQVSSYVSGALHIRRGYLLLQIPCLNMDEAKKGPF